MVVATGAAGTDLKDTLGSLTKSIQKQNAMAEEQKKKSAAQARKKLEVADEKAKQALDKLKNQIANSSGEQKTQLEEQLKAAKESASMAAADLKSSADARNLELKQQREQTVIARQAQGISLEQLQEDRKIKADIMAQKAALAKLSENSDLTTDQLKKTNAYQQAQDRIERAEKRLENRQNRRIQMNNLKQTLSLSKMVKGFKNLPNAFVGGLKKLGVGAKDKIMAGLMPALKTAAFIGFLVAFKKFIDSPLYEKTKDFIVDKVLPFVKGTINVIKNIFKFLFFKDGVDGKGLRPAIRAIMSFFTDTIPQKFEDAKKAITNFFVGEDGESGLIGGIKGFFNDVKGFFTKTIPEKIEKVKTKITDFFTGEEGIITKITEFFKFDFESLKATIKDNFNVESFLDIVFIPYDAAVKALMGFFGFSEEDIKAFSMKDLITDTVKKVGDFFKDIFSFDGESMLGDIKGKIADMGLVLKAMTKGSIAAAKAIAPGGESPAEAYRRVYNETMATGESQLDTAGTGDAQIAEQIAAEDRGGGKIVTTSSGAAFIQGEGAQEIIDAMERVNGTSQELNNEMATNVANNQNGSPNIVQVVDAKSNNNSQTNNTVVSKTVTDNDPILEAAF